MKILVACEESQAVTAELRKLGHEAYSCSASVRCNARSKEQCSCFEDKEK